MSTNDELTPEQMDEIVRRVNAAAGASGQTREARIAAGMPVPMRIGASHPVRALREAYEEARDRELAKYSTGKAEPFWTHERRKRAIEAGEAAALALGREMFPSPPIHGPELRATRDRNVIAIAKKEATLRGWSDDGFTFHDEPCEACKGNGRDPENQHEACDQCRGDGFAPPIEEG